MREVLVVVLVVFCCLVSGASADELSALRISVGLLADEEICNALDVTGEQAKCIQGKFRKLFGSLALLESRIGNARFPEEREKLVEESRKLIEKTKEILREDLVDAQIDKLLNFGRQMDNLTFIPSAGLLENPMAEEYGIKGELRRKILKIDREVEEKIQNLHEKYFKEMKKLLNERDFALKDALGEEKAGRYDNYFGEPFVRALEVYIVERRWRIKEYSRKHEGYRN